MSIFTPTQEEVEGAYIDDATSAEDYNRKIDEFGRYNAKVQADALREAAQDAENYAPIDAGTVSRWLNARAEILYPSTLEGKAQ